MYKFNRYSDEDEDNPVLLFLFDRGWEDPDWGLSPVGQVVTASVIHEFANRITDSETSKEIKNIAGKIVELNSKKMVSGK